MPVDPSPRVASPSRLPALPASRLADRVTDEAGAGGPAAASILDWLRAPSTHPEEMKAAYDLRLGPRIRLQGGARMTPAAVATAGVAVAAILLGVAAVVRATRR